MLVRVPPPWFLPESAATPETVYRGPRPSVLDRRALLRGIGLVGLSATGLGSAVFAADAPATNPTPSPSPAAGNPGEATVTQTPAAPGAKLYPATRNPRYVLDRPMTSEEVAGRHNVFDEISLQRDKVWQLAGSLKLDPWTIHIGGAVERELTLDVDELLRRIPVEERVYRHRCVETWAMAVPWSGIPLARLVELAKPTATAKFLRMVSFARPEQAPGWYGSRRVFPYYEAVSLGEATNELAFLATGIYGHSLPPQHGAPLRLVLPWKYGLKSIKSIVGFQFTRERPGTFWNELSPTNYSFSSNVDPTGGPGTQTHETMLGSEERHETKTYNGYAEMVAGLYPTPASLPSS